MVKLSVNINKIATLRNARGGNIPNLDFFTDAIINFGADGITIHPRPDERHIKIHDVYSINKVINNRVEFNIEGYPSRKFIDMVLKVHPTQVTLVPDPPNVLTSLAGWDTIQHKEFLYDIIKELQKSGIRTSIFVHPDIKMIQGSADINADRVELFTGLYANASSCIDSYIQCSQYASNLGLDVNAGHDLDLNNLTFFIKKMSFLKEVSIGHALISESLILGLEETIRRYKKILS
tara:strand:- start:629 stop:1333 length:705 start_codon:yes stop_codon:yes gene_type:complete